MKTLKAMISKNIPLGIYFFILGSLLFFGACEKGSKEVLTLTSPDSKFEIRVPGAWKKEVDLHGSAEIQASHRGTNQFLLVIRESKEDFDEIELTEYCDIVFKNIREKLEKVEVAQPMVLVVDGKKALQTEVQGIYENVKIVYLYTCIESPKHFYQVVAWTTASKFKKYRSNFEKITDFFREFD